jgi:GntR family transcriptional regulator
VFNQKQKLILTWCTTRLSIVNPRSFSSSQPRNTIIASLISHKERTTPVPVVRYPEVLTDLRSKILDGTYPVDEPLPHSDVLRKQYGMGTNGMTRVMKELQAEGLIWRVANRGMIVQAPPPPAVTYDGFSSWPSACQQVGATGSIVFIRARHEPAEPDVAQALGLEAGELVVHRSHRAVVNDQIAFLDETYYPLDLVRHTPIATPAEIPGTTADLLNHVTDLTTARVSQRFSAHTMTDDEAKALKARGPVAVLDVTRITWTGDGQPIELRRRTANGARVHLSEDLPGIVAFAPC